MVYFGFQKHERHVLPRDYYEPWIRIDYVSWSWEEDGHRLQCFCAKAERSWCEHLRCFCMTWCVCLVLSLTSMSSNSWQKLPVQDGKAHKRTNVAVLFYELTGWGVKRKFNYYRRSSPPYLSLQRFRKDFKQLGAFETPITYNLDEVMLNLLPLEEEFVESQTGVIKSFFSKNPCRWLRRCKCSGKFYGMGRQMDCGPHTWQEIRFF